MRVLPGQVWVGKFRINLFRLVIGKSEELSDHWVCMTLHDFQSEVALMKITSSWLLQNYELLAEWKP